MSNLGALDYLSADERREMDRHLSILAQYPKPLTEYQYRPLDFMVEIMDIPRHTLDWELNDGYAGHRWDGTRNPIRSALEALAEWEDVGIESCTGSGKSFLLALITFWFLACFEDSIVESYATKEKQLELAMWKEIGDLWPRFHRHFPMATLTQLRIRMDGVTDKWSAYGKAAAVRAGEDSATKAQGAHAAHMLQIVEEMPGVNTAIAKAITNTRSARHNIQIGVGNPDSQSDALHEYCLRSTTRHIIISGYDHPNVVTGQEIVPGATSAIGIRRILEAEDNDPESPMFKSRARGISPRQSANALIKRDWVEAAERRYERELKHALLLRLPLAIGLDVADSPKGDYMAKVLGRGHVAISCTEQPVINANIIGTEMFNQAVEQGIEAEHIGVDPVGVGAGTVNEMVRLGMEPRRLGGSLAAVDGAQRAADTDNADYVPDSNSYNNLRTQMAWQLREDLRLGRIALSPAIVKALMAQLTIMWYRRNPASGDVELAHKADIIAKYGESPNGFDALMYWNWVRPRTMAAQDHESSDDQHPGFDYKRRERKPRRRAVNEDGTLQDIRDGDLRPNRFTGDLPHYRMPRPYRPGDDDESDMDEE